MGTGSFPGVKRPGDNLNYPPPPTVKVEERAELYLYSPLCLHDRLQGESDVSTLPFSCLL